MLEAKPNSLAEAVQRVLEARINHEDVPQSVIAWWKNYLKTEAKKVTDVEDLRMQGYMEKEMLREEEQKQQIELEEEEDEKAEEEAEKPPPSNRMIVIEGAPSLDEVGMLLILTVLEEGAEGVWRTGEALTALESELHIGPVLMELLGPTSHPHARPDFVRNLAVGATARGDRVLLLPEADVPAFIEYVAAKGFTVKNAIPALTLSPGGSKKVLAEEDGPGPKEIPN